MYFKIEKKQLKIFGSKKKPDNIVGESAGVAFSLYLRCSTNIYLI